MENGTIYGNFMVKFIVISSSLDIVWGFYGENMVNQITRQSPY